MKKNVKKNKWLEKDIDKAFNYEKITFIYCGRLLKSKCINIFLDLLKEYSSSRGLVFGDIDPSSKDSLSLENLDDFSERGNDFYINSRDETGYFKHKFLLSIIDDISKIAEAKFARIGRMLPN